MRSLPNLRRTGVCSCGRSRVTVEDVRSYLAQLGNWDDDEPDPDTRRRVTLARLRAGIDIGVMGLGELGAGCGCEVTS